MRCSLQGLLVALAPGLQLSTVPAVASSHCTCHPHPQQRGSAHLCLYSRRTVATPDSRIRTRGSRGEGNRRCSSYMARWLVAAVRAVCSVLCALWGPAPERVSGHFAHLTASFFLGTYGVTPAPRMEWELVWIHSGFGLAASKVARRVSTGTESRYHTRAQPPENACASCITEHSPRRPSTPGLRMKHPYARTLNSLLDRSSLLVFPLNLSSLTTSGTDLAFVGDGEKNVSLSVTLFSLPFSASSPPFASDVHVPLYLTRYSGGFLALSSFNA